MKKVMHKKFGRHYLVELIGCDPRPLKRVADVQKLLLRAARKSQATILKYFFHQFAPAGVTGIILITESHFFIHTWPDDRYAALDIFTCGTMRPQAAIADLKKSFGAQKLRIRTFARGF